MPNGFLQPQILPPKAALLPDFKELLPPLIASMQQCMKALDQRDYSECGNDHDGNEVSALQHLGNFRRVQYPYPFT